MAPAVLAAAGARPTPQPSSQKYAFDRAIAPEYARVAEMRHAVADRMRDWDVLQPVADTVVLVVSELVTNSIVHGRGDVHVSMRQLCAGLYIKVADESTVPALMQPVGPDEVGGRGLHIVDAFCDLWGVSDDGTITWCLLRAAGRS